MAIALVKLGTITSGNGTTSDTPAFGQATTAGNLLVAWVSSFSTSNAIATTATGWAQAAQISNSNGSSAVFYKANCGASETAPTFTCTSSTKMYSQLGEFSGAATTSPVDQTGSGSGTISPLGVNTSAADTQTGDLLLCATTWGYSKAETSAFSPKFNGGNVTAVDAGHQPQGSTTDTQQADFSYGFPVTSNSTADSADPSGQSTKLSFNMLVVVSFSPAATASPPVPFRTVLQAVNRSAVM